MQIKRFQTRPKPIEANKFAGLVGNGVTAEPRGKGIAYSLMTNRGKVMIKPGDYIVTDEFGYKHAYSPEEFGKNFDLIEDAPVSPEIDGDNCLRCGQSIAKRKVVFGGGLVGALIKAYFYASEKQKQVVRISELNLNNIEYTRMNDLVRFGLLYKSGEKTEYGEYGVPRKRIAEFLNDKWPVAKYFYKNPLTGEHEMSEERIYFSMVPSTAKLVEQYGEKLTAYIHNDIDMAV